MVEKFWLNLKRHDFVVVEVMEIGKSIVENYLVIKRLYELVIKENAEHREIVIMSINFY